MSMRWIVLLVLAPLMSAQQVLVVDDDGGPGVDHTSLSDAVSAAAEGDVILVKDGDYGVVNIAGKSVSLVAEVGADVHLLGGLSIWGLAANQSVHVRGLSATGGAGTFGSNPALRVSASEGLVWIESCFFASSSDLPGGEVASASQVVLVDVTLLGANAFTPFGPTSGAAGLECTSSSVYLYGGQARGGENGCEVFCGEGGRGVWLHDSLLVAQDSLLQGGAAEGLERGLGFPFCEFGGGGPGVYATGGSDVQLLDCEVSGGEALNACAWAGPADDLVDGTRTDHPGTAVTASLPAPLREGEAATLTITGEPGHAAWLIVGIEGAPSFLPALGSTWLLGGTLPPIALGPMPPGGQLDLPLVAPTLPGGLEGAELYFQAATQGGGVTVLGSGVRAVVISAAFTP